MAENRIGMDVTNLHWRLCALYRRGAFDGPHPDPAHNPDSNPGWLNVLDCAASVVRGAVSLEELDAYVVVRLGGHGVGCGLLGGGRCTCERAAR